MNQLLDPALAPRSTSETLQQQRRQFERHVCFPFIEALPGGVFILNANREIVYLHPRSASLLRGRRPDDCIGLRVGEALGCVNASLGPNGCHSSRFCSYCGAYKALACSDCQEEGREECNLIRTVDGRLETLCLAVLAVRVTSGGEQYYVFSVLNRTETKELVALERFFFHDVLNLAGGVRGMLEVLAPQLSGMNESGAEILVRAASRLVDEIKVQKKISEGMRNELVVARETLRSERIGEDVVWLYQGYWPNGPRIELDERFESLLFESDRALLERVLGNMLKNAAEASTRDQRVSLGCERHGDKLRFWVRNETPLAPDVRNQIFRSSFSTKGRTRGLGTLSMKLLGERYLGGKVGFRTGEDLGTVFHLDLPMSPPAESVCDAGAAPDPSPLAG